MSYSGIFIVTILALAITNISGSDTTVNLRNESVVVEFNQTFTLNCSDIPSPIWTSYNVTGNTTTNLTANNYVSFESTLLIVKSALEEHLTVEYKCSGNDSSIRFLPLPKPHMKHQTKSSVTVTEGGYVSVKCHLIVGYHHNQAVNWTWTLNNETLSNNTRFTILIEKDHSELVFRKITYKDGGDIKCNAKNDVGSYEQEVKLRVKDTLSALWPFLVIVGEVIILCIIILVFEKKCSKKSSTSEDEAENLMKQKDNNNNSDLKKRSVKA